MDKLQGMAEATQPQAPEPRVVPPWELLGPFERFAYRTMAWLNRALPGAIWQRFVVEPLLYLFLGRRMVIRGLERVQRLPRDASILLVANHRTFFDLFVLSWVLLRRSGLRWRLSFPVRSNFFYDNPVGLLVAAGMSGGSMFPPFFRAAEKRAANVSSLGVLIQQLREPGHLVGFHPEGTRKQEGDPYDLLPAQPGVGELALKSRALVVPAFVTGLSNSVWRELWDNLRGRSPVVAVYGDPVDLSEFPQETRLSINKKCADKLRDAIASLGAEEREVRKGLAAR
jgi:1-acyl-sn-glycerol-3-phosphate acyltransferase